MLLEPTDPRGRVELEAARVASRLAALGARRVPPEVVAPACADLARLAWAAEGLPGAPPAIAVAPHGWRDVVRVLAADLLAVTPDAAELGAAADRLTRLRRQLP